METLVLFTNVQKCWKIESGEPDGLTPLWGSVVSDKMVLCSIWGQRKYSLHLHLLVSEPDEGEAKLVFGGFQWFVWYKMFWYSQMIFLQKNTGASNTFYAMILLAMIRFWTIILGAKWPFICIDTLLVQPGRAQQTFAAGCLPVTGPRPIIFFMQWYFWYFL